MKKSYSLAKVLFIKRESVAKLISFYSYNMGGLGTICRSCYSGIHNYMVTGHPVWSDDSLAGKNSGVVYKVSAHCTVGNFHPKVPFLRGRRDLCCGDYSSASNHRAYSANQYPIVPQESAVGTCSDSLYCHTTS